MKKYLNKFTISSAIVLGVFILFTILVKVVNVAPIGPNGSSIGFSTINEALAQFFDASSIWETISEVLIIITFLIAITLIVLAVVQLVQRKRFFKIDKELLITGIIYVAVVLAFILFELISLNFRPVLIDGELEASYPSTHTMLAITILGTAYLIAPKYIKNKSLCLITQIGLIGLIAFSVISRTLAGVHWFTDILGAILISVAFILLYLGLKEIFCKNESNNNENDCVESEESESSETTEEEAQDNETEEDIEENEEDIEENEEEIKEELAEDENETSEDENFDNEEEQENIEDENLNSDENDEDNKKDKKED